MGFPYTEDQYRSKRIKIEQHIKSKIPKFQIKSKQESKFMRFLAKLLFFVKGFLTGYVTTIYPVVYFPKLPYARTLDRSFNDILYITVLAHEYVHLYDRKRLWQLFNLLYISPQILALLSLLAIVSSLWWLVALVALAPIPSIGRAWLEFRGYRMTMAVYWWLSGRRRSSEDLAYYFTSSSYYWMMPFRKLMVRFFDKSFEKIEQNKLTKELQEVYDVLFT